MKRARISLLLAGLCLAEIGCNQVRAPELVKIPLLSCSGLPCVDATFGQTKLKLLIDLADQTSYLTRLGLVKAEAQRPGKEFGKVRRFKLGAIELSDLFAVDDNFNEALAKPAESLTPAVDGTLSYNAFNDRLVVLNIPGRAIELSAEPLTRSVCPGNCGQLQDSKAGNTGTLTLTTDGFAVGNIPLRARVDTLFQGAVAILNPIPGLKIQAAGPIEGSYRTSKLSYLEAAPVYLAGKPIASSAVVGRADDALGTNGAQYNSAIGLAILSTGAYALDLRSMKIWRYD